MDYQNNYNDKWEQMIGENRNFKFQQQEPQNLTDDWEGLWFKQKQQSWQIMEGNQTQAENCDQIQPKTNRCNYRWNNGLLHPYRLKVLYKWHLESFQEDQEEKNEANREQIDLQWWEQGHVEEISILQICGESNWSQVAIMAALYYQQKQPEIMTLIIWKS